MKELLLDIVGRARGRRSRQVADPARPAHREPLMESPTDTRAGPAQEHFRVTFTSKLFSFTMTGKGRMVVLVALPMVALLLLPALWLLG